MKLKIKDKVKMYEDFIHKINMACTIGDNIMLQELIANADAYSYSFRQGNGMLSEKKQLELINAKFQKLCLTPKADEERDRRRALRGKTVCFCGRDDMHSSKDCNTIENYLNK